MAYVSWVAWPDLPAVVHGGKANLDGTPDMVPRLLLAVALPATAAILGVVLSAVGLVGPRVEEALHLPHRWTARSLTRSMNTVLSLLSLFLLVAHGTLVLGQAGRGIPVEQVMGVAVGLLLVGVGLSFPRAEARYAPATVLHRWWTAARVPAAVAFAVVGLTQTAASLLVPTSPLPTLVPLLLLPALGAAAGVAALRSRS
ncbi:hypothetical protein ACFWTE_26965 [Nocardiopsis sp. NPDC058631]|uniref:hypothetical protein n=1 Tax=Nocardiopsis sp. NPDC058631 TaxID=3346566 RepID=UPI00365097F2